MSKLAHATAVSLCVAMSWTGSAGPATADSACDIYLQEAEAVSGVAPRFDDDGAFRSIVSYGTGSFVAVKPQLIDAARSLAEMSAKKNLAAWMAEKFLGNTSATNQVSQAETTDAEGNGMALAASLSVLSEAYQADSEALLRGVIKLDECVDPEAKVVYVAMGWKPPPIPATPTPTVAVAEAQSAPSRGGVTVVQVDVEGFGPDQTLAINDGLRIAVSQVYGERFVSSLGTRSLVMTTENLVAEGDSGVVASVDQMVESTSQSDTAGIISGYRIIGTDAADQGVRVRLVVEIPRYQPPDLGAAQMMVVLPPRLLSLANGVEFAEHLPNMQRQIESGLTQSKSIRVLNRENLPALDAELGAIANEGSYRPDEAAKLGNRLGADLVLITEIGRFDLDRQMVKLGTRDVEIVRLKGEAWVKVINVVTSDTVFALRLPVGEAGMSGALDLGDAALELGEQIAQSVGEAIGGGFSPVVAIRLETSGVKAGGGSGVVLETGAIQAATEDKVEAVKKEIADDW